VSQRAFYISASIATRKIMTLKKFPGKFVRPQIGLVPKEILSSFNLGKDVAVIFSLRPTTISS